MSGLFASFCCIVLLNGAVLSPSSGQANFVAHSIDDNAHGTASLYACDLDADGDLDVLGAVLEDSSVVWWRNENGRAVEWTRLVLDDDFDGAISVFAGDLDGDGDLDVVAGAATGDEISWWRNDGGDPLRWTKFVVRSGYDFAHEVYVHDLDRDGDLDILGASSYLDEITWWSNGGGNPVVWTEQTIGSNFSRAKSVRVADLDADGDLDVLGAALEGNEVAWWRNDGQNPVVWTRFTISGDFAGAHRVQAVDMDGDGDLDVLGAAYFGHEVAWWRNDGGGDIASDPLAWTKQVIGAGFERACIAAAADLDGDKDLDVAGSSQNGNEVAIWLNGGENPIVWTKVHIDTLERVWPLYLCDLDGDGDVDILAASGWRGVNQVKWWENRQRR